MSEGADRNRVFRTTRVRTPLKNDVSWIQKSAQEKDEEDSARTEQQAVETRPGLLRLNSYVLSTAKKFESLASPQSPPHQNMHFIPSKGPQAPTEELIQSGEEQPEKSLDYTTVENKEENADQSNVELRGGTAEVSADLHVNEHILNGEAQPVSLTKEAVEPAEHPVTDITAENKGEYADTADDQSNVEQSEVKVSADARVESPAAETSAAAGTEESKDTAEILLKPQEEPSSETVPAHATKLEDAGVEPAVQHAEGRCPPEQAAEEIVLLKAVVAVVVESSPDESDVIIATPEEEATVQQIVEPVPDLVADSVSELPPQPAAEAATDGNQDEGPPEQAVVETVEAVTEVNVASLPEAPVVIDTAGEEAVIQACLESVPDLVAESVSELPPEPAAEAATDGCLDKGPPEQAAEEIVDAVTEVDVASLPETLAVTDAVEEAVVQQSVEQVPDLVVESVSELPPEPAAEVATEGNQDEGPPEQAVVETVEAEAPAVIDTAGEEAVVQACLEPVPDLVAESVSELPPEPAAEEIAEAVVAVVVESSPDESDVINATLEEEAAVQQIVESVPDLVAESVSELPPQPAAVAPAEGSHDKDPPEQTVVETVETVTEVNVASLPDTPAVIEAPGEEVVVQQSVEQVPELVVESVSELPPQPAAETAAVSAASTEPVLQTRAEVVECEVQPANNTAVEQSIEPTPESAAVHKVELCIEDAVEPTTAPEAEAAQEFTYRVIELTEALDVEPPAPEAADEPLKSPEQSHTEETTPAISDMVQKPVEEVPSTRIVYGARQSPSVCSICDKIIGNIKLSLSEPPVICHPECLKCGLCDKALGDLLTPMFLHNQVIQCDGCCAKTLKT